ncbi:hypothetical protein B0X71_09235 [Planococcus lenghuensis]|uniref:Alkyl hydroperoxide reductase subunit C/ Thiol specific antioxidant domain-containing protein n=1 Tax=Planococcus lenghuensis TaxID=2213202 RepID=A0A1Q2KYL6_9BACL|nr:hypothetical protein B0X71_09235 [Planococcus lenghuensis]
MNQKKKQQQNKTWLMALFVTGILILALTVLVSIQKEQTAASGTVGVDPGTAAPEFTLASTEGDISLSDYRGKNVLLYFYEGNG